MDPGGGGRGTRGGHPTCLVDGGRRGDILTLAECDVGLDRGETERVRGGARGDEASPRLRRRGMRRTRRCGGDERDGKAGGARYGGIEAGREGSGRPERDGDTRRSEGAGAAATWMTGLID